ncbi:ankyrin repeat-containing domain protein [Dipodascopsis tothii]|uniref:ankyrin repeat-containing domain protein n=1 Tax=Dipodascopsis tothii TaxID=44089 RepID=UPI0034D0009A
MLEPSVRLRQAIINDKLSIVQRLLRRFPDLLTNPDPGNGWTSLHYAAYHGHFDICVVLTSLGHDSTEISLDVTGHTPLHLSALKNREKTVHFLAQKFPEVIDWRTSPSKTVGYTALILASKEGHGASASILLDFGASVDLGDLEGSRPLHYAAAYGHRKVIRTLVERGADYKTPNFLGWTPLSFSFSVSTWNYLSSLMLERDNDKKRKLKQKQLEDKLRLEKSPSIGSAKSLRSVTSASSADPDDLVKVRTGSVASTTTVASAPVSSRSNNSIHSLIIDTMDSRGPLPAAFSAPGTPSAHAPATPPVM